MVEPDGPYDEDGYCESCGNGRWRYHTPDCAWADQRDGHPFEQASDSGDAHA